MINVNNNKNDDKKQKECKEINKKWKFCNFDLMMPSELGRPLGNDDADDDDWLITAEMHFMPALWHFDELLQRWPFK